jgi:hypothetical protein
MNPTEHRSHFSTPKRISSKGHYQEPTSPQIIFLEYQPQQQVIFQLTVSRNTESVELDEHDISAKLLKPESYHEKAKEESPGREKRVTSDTEKEPDPEVSESGTGANAIEIAADIKKRRRKKRRKKINFGHPTSYSKLTLDRGNRASS